MNENGTPVTENEYVKELLGILKDNGKDTSGLTALFGHIGEMENFVKRAEERIADMKSQLDSMKEVQNHPIKNTLKNTIKALETKVAEIKAQLSELKNNIIDGCKSAVAAFKAKGITVLSNIASFFRIKNGLQAMKNNIDNSINNCDKAVIKIKSFAKEYHSAGRHIKNMARVMVGKKPIDTQKEAGKLAKVVAAPYNAHKAVLTGLKNTIDKTVTTLGQLEQSAETKRGERTAAKKPTLMERLAVNKEKVKQQELEKPTPDRTKSKGLEV